MIYIDINDFIGEIDLALSNDPNVIANFEAIAGRIEIDILRDLLNDKLYNDLIANTTSGVPQDEVYYNLVNGATYTDLSGETILYEGLKRMIRYFVYEKYLDIQYYQNTSIGQMQGQNENSVALNRSQIRKARAAIQHEAVRLYRKAAIFINDNYSDYFTESDYDFWQPAQKKFLGSIISMTYNNQYFYNKSSEGN
jgi:hypothetical protein